jgi:plasmid replication initiation protein
MSMRKLFGRLFVRLGKHLVEGPVDTAQQQEIINIPPPGLQGSILPMNFEKVQEEEKPKKKIIEKKTNSKLSKDIIEFDPRDMMEIMEYPYLSLSKNRTAPINYERETSSGLIKIKVSCHPPHYVASIYDWDIIMFVESKMQEIMNSGSDIPPRTLIIPRHELLKSLHKHEGNKQNKDLHSSLTRLKTTVIETSVRNEDKKYDCFGWLDSWGYTERKDIKEIKITISQWLYDGICKKGALLKVKPEYFDITSGLKKFLYRTARKHVGTQNDSWSISLETLYEKSSVERDLRKFKYDLKKVVYDNDIPGYLLEWIEENGKISVRFINARKEIKRMLSESNSQPPLPFL